MAGTYEPPRIEARDEIVDPLIGATGSGLESIPGP
jgi:hypothetical protein